MPLPFATYYDRNLPDLEFMVLETLSDRIFFAIRERDTGSTQIVDVWVISREAFNRCHKNGRLYSEQVN